MSENRSQQAMKNGSKSGNRLVMLLVVAVVAAGIAFMVMRNGEEVVEAPPKPKPGQEAVRLDLPVKAPQKAAVAKKAEKTDNPKGEVSENNAAETTTADTGHNVKHALQSVTQEEAAVQQAGRVVRPAFITDLATFLVDGYYPKGTHPNASKSAFLNASPKRINQHYGVEMTGLSWAGDDILKARRAVLAHVLTPAVQDMLYMMYADDLVAEMEKLVSERTVDGRKLQKREIREMFQLYAQQVRGTAGVLRATAKMEGAMARVQALHSAAETALKANGTFLSALHEYQELQDNNAADELIVPARAAMDKASAAYNQAIVQRERVREGLGNALRRYKWVKEIPVSEAVYVASWVYRRTQHVSSALPKIMKAHELLLDLSAQLLEVAKKYKK